MCGWEFVYDRFQPIYEGRYVVARGAVYFYDVAAVCQRADGFEADGAQREIGNEVAAVYLLCQRIKCFVAGKLCVTNFVDAVIGVDDEYGIDRCGLFMKAIVKEVAVFVEIGF